MLLDGDESVRRQRMMMIGYHPDDRFVHTWLGYTIHESVLVMSIGIAMIPIWSLNSRLDGWYE